MGNGLARLTPCLPASCCCSGRSRRRHDIAAVVSEPLDEGLGHSFCYVRPESASVLLPSSKVHSEDSATTTTFRAISGASVCANTATPPLSDFYSYGYYDRSSAAFQSSTSFAAIPLQPIPKTASGPIPLSGPIERGFMSGPIERGFMSGPLDRGGLFSGPLAGEPQEKEKFQRSFSHGGFQLKRLRSRKGSLIRAIKKAISKTIGQNSMIAPVAKAPVLVKDLDWAGGGPDQIIGPENLTVSSATNLSSNMSMEDDDSMEGQNLQWAQGKAGEDRVHVVVSEEHGWVFVGIYDGFNGPDAPDYLLSNLYPTVHKELKGLLWEDNKFEFLDDSSSNSNPEEESALTIESDQTRETSSGEETESCSYPIEGKKAKARRSKNNRFRNAAKRWEENQRKWRSEWERDRLELERRLKEQLSRSNSNQQVNHSDVLKAMSQALRKTEEGYLDIADQMLVENPELALMGSCVLVMLMKGEDVYLMNVGDSRAVLAQSAESGVWESLGKDHGDLERISEENWQDLEASEADQSDRLPSLSALQLSADHSTSVKEEVQRIRNEHPDDASAIVNDRVKGSLKVTRAFGAGFLKKPKWNNALLEIFRVDYVGSSPYINCNPSLYHHRLGPKDRFLILTSDGLYQYFTNEEAVAQVELFIELWPEGDPAQHLVEEVLFRAAKKAGMDFHELLEIPQGDRRRYHDDVSIIVISLEGRIWRSSV